MSQYVDLKYHEILDDYLLYFEDKTHQDVGICSESNVEFCDKDYSISTAVYESCCKTISSYVSHLVLL
ncbi:hypothetical protein Ark11_1440 [Candidatus Ichthyocystis hellenicum]|uniref:Uncharacterized protein n=2 Tax=Candidatus Ichthyocystis TaxID=2929841 RepID=A0A0S4M586_9BURK|nr:hypothetical protein [Candidatus Ichthyocystis hellenicum]CUT18239.1 hypothetical protein Ark11_1440 [Candidatus Ichthyocystis hellenicum]